MVATLATGTSNKFIQSHDETSIQVIQNNVKKGCFNGSVVGPVCMYLSATEGMGYNASTEIESFGQDKL